MGFEPGTPDPNLYQSELQLGAPLPWLIVREDRQETATPQVSKVTRFKIVNFLIHDAVAGIPLVILWLLKRPKNRDEEGGDDPEN